MSNHVDPTHPPLQVAWTFGRSASCDVVINDSAVSNRHGRLTQLGEQYVIEDLGSTNGIYVNGVRINQPTVIGFENQVSLGQRFAFPWLLFPIQLPPEMKANLEALAAPSSESSPDPMVSPADEETVRGVAPKVDDEPQSDTSRIKPIVQTTGKASLVVGRDPTADVVINDPTVSWRHAQVEIRDDFISIIDLGSANGVFRDASQQRVISLTIGVSEFAYLGAFRLEGREMAGWFDRDPASLEVTSSPIETKPNSSQQAASPFDTVHLGKPKERKMTLVSDASEIDRSQPPKFITVPDHPVILGRDPSSDYVMNYPMISWRHARIWRDNQTIWLEDLGSTNGTYVNGRRIRGRHQVRPGDAIALGSYRITFNEVDAGIDLVAQDCRGALTLEARGVTVKVPGRTLIDNISLTIEPGEFVGLMGPSGSGKSTLISALNGYRQPEQGAVLLGGTDLHQDFGLFRGQIGYVPQDDIMHPELTVGEALYYTARLRLPADFSDTEIDLRINDVLSQLGLSDVKESVIGSPDQRGLSGGERKRVNLAMELLTDPSILFLDEPTSGLSSVDTMIVMNLLRDLANRGKSILLTIHQPGMDAYQKLDHLMLLSRDSGTKEPGVLAFFGPAYPDAIDYFRQHSQADIASSFRGPDEMLNILTQKPSHVWVAMFGQSTYRSRWITQRQGKALSESNPNRSKSKRGIGLRQAWTLSRRTLNLKLRDRANSLLLLAQAPIIALLIAVVFGKKASQTTDWFDMSGATATTLFLIALSSIWCGCSNAIREIVGERAIYKRERMVNLRIPSYILGKVSILLLLSLVQTILMLAIVYPATGLDGPWWLYGLVLMLASCLGIAIGLSVSALTRSTEFAVSTLPLIILPNVMLGGVLMPIQEMPAVGQWIAQAVPARWAFETLIIEEAKAKPKSPERTLQPPASQTSEETDETAKQPDGDSVDKSDPVQEALPTKGGAETQNLDATPDLKVESKNAESTDIAERFFGTENRRGLAFNSCILLGMGCFAFCCVALFLKRRDR